jgi:hypothetical protein
MKSLTTKSVTTIAVVVCLIALGLALATRTNADTWDRLTKVTFSGPVEIPGQVLPAGTYWLKLLDSPSNRNIVQIFNEDRNKVHATILAIPDYRLKPADKTVITFDEREANSPPAVKAWFYPGDTYGQEFVYPKVRAVRLAEIVHQPVPSMPANLEADTKIPAKSANDPSVVALKKAPVKAEQPTGEEVEIADLFPVPPQLLAQNTSPTQSSSPAHKLPATASELPLVGLLGLLLASAGVLLRFAARRLS